MPLKTRTAKLELGKNLRKKCPRSSHANWNFGERDSLRILIESNQGREPKLVPIRHGRMLGDAFVSA